MGFIEIITFPLNEQLAEYKHYPICATPCIGVAMGCLTSELFNF